MKNTLWVVGDSTLSSFEDKYYYPRYGYGTQLSVYLDSQIEVENLALSGRSSKSFTKEPEYNTLVSGMKNGDFLLIGFGHNDEKTEEGRFTSPVGDYNTEGSFANMLYSAYIEPAKKAGCQCILCTPIVRRTTTDFWQNQQLHITADSGNFKGGDYPQAVRELGEALNIPVVDMTELTRNLYEKLTPQHTVYLHAWPSQNKVSVDNTHTNIWGARVNACLCLNEVKKLEISGLSSHVTGIDIKDALDMQKYLVSNPDYKAVVYTSDLTKSSLWEDADGFSGTVFGDVGDSLSKENFVLEKCDGGVHIAVKNNSGKIAAVSDGIAMYYKKVRTGKAFTLKAAVHINDYFLNDQVSFGLMVRDDMYIDKATADLLGDYVAAAPLHLTKKDKSRCCFARKSGELVMGGTCTREYKPGDTVKLCIQSGSDGYACTFGDEETVTGGFDFPLTGIDADYVYVGMFAARNADVTFFDISFEIEED